MANKVDPELLSLIGDLHPDEYPILADLLEQWAAQLRLVSGIKWPASFSGQSQEIKMLVE